MALHFAQEIIATAPVLVCNEVYAVRAASGSRRLHARDRDCRLKFQTFGIILRKDGCSTRLHALQAWSSAPGFYLP